MELSKLWIMIKGINKLVVFLVIAGLSACATVPLTGRKQMNLLPAATMAEMGFKNYGLFLDTTAVSKNQQSLRDVKEVGHKISTTVEKYMKEIGMEKKLQHYDWEFNLVADKTPNAWCMPGGKVVFYEGILPFTKDKNGIAVVMGHEIAHAIARHGNERMSQGLVTQLGGVALAVAIQEKPEQTQQLFLMAYGFGSQLGVLLPYSRLHEKEADRLGLNFMAMAGYDPNHAIAFWERMSKSGGAKPPEWLSTHPMDETRIAEMKKNLPEAFKHYQATR